MLGADASENGSSTRNACILDQGDRPGSSHTFPSDLSASKPSLEDDGRVFFSSSWKCLHRPTQTCVSQLIPDAITLTIKIAITEERSSGLVCCVGVLIRSTSDAWVLSALAAF